MRFAFTDDQLLFRDTVADLLSKECPPEAVRWAWADEGGRRPELWAALAEMGVVGLTVPEAHGGLGLTELDLLPLLVEAGRVAFPGPLLETTAVAAPLLAESAPAAAGRAVAPRHRVGRGRSSPSTWPGSPSSPTPTSPTCSSPSATTASSPSPATGCASPRSAPSTARGGCSAPSGTRPTPRSWSPASRAGRPPTWRSTAVPSPRRGCSSGSARACSPPPSTTSPARKQFGVPVGTFQAVKHHLADCELKLSFARPVVMNAAYSLTHGLPDAARDVSMAKAFASDAAAFVARQALQCHGAIGYTTEYDLHLYLKRVLGPGRGVGRRRVAPPAGRPTAARRVLTRPAGRRSPRAGAAMMGP